MFNHMKYNPFLDVLGQSLASVLSDDRMDSISASLSSPSGKYPRVRKFHPGREVLPASAPAR